MPVREEREALAAKRLRSVLGTHGAAIARTIEQKISDAGPFNQRIDPHILIPVRNQLVKAGNLQKIRRHQRDWYAIPEASEDFIDERIAAQFDVLKLMTEAKFSSRIGDALEIAVFRALRESTLNSNGGFRGLTNKPTTAKLRKEEPPSIINGRELQGNKKFDFHVGTDIWAGVECKNLREWLYPNREEIRHLLGKAIELDIPPILIGRRIPYVTRRLLQPAGVLVWETRSQFYPAEYDNISALVKQKELLGYFDVRVTDYPTPQLKDFICRIIPEEIGGARERFDQYKDLLSAYANGELKYRGFAARVRRRENGTNEDTDTEPEDEEPEHDVFGD